MSQTNAYIAAAIETLKSLQKYLEAKADTTTKKGKEYYSASQAVEKAIMCLRNLTD